MSNTAKSRMTAQRHTKTIDTPKPSTGHCAALERDKIQLHQPEPWHKLLQPGKHHRTLIQPHPQGQTPQPRRTRTLKPFFHYKSHSLFSLHISAFTLAFCGAVEFSSLFFMLKNKFFLRLFFFHPPPRFGDFSDFVFDIFDWFS